MIISPAQIEGDLIEPWRNYKTFFNKGLFTQYMHLPHFGQNVLDTKEDSI